MAELPSRGHEWTAKTAEYKAKFQARVWATKKAFELHVGVAAMPNDFTSRSDDLLVLLRARAAQREKYAVAAGRTLQAARKRPAEQLEEVARLDISQPNVEKAVASVPPTKKQRGAGDFSASQWTQKVDEQPRDAPVTSRQPPVSSTTLVGNPQWPEGTTFNCIGNSNLFLVQPVDKFLGEGYANKTRAELVDEALSTPEDRLGRIPRTAMDFRFIYFRRMLMIYFGLEQD